MSEKTIINFENRKPVKVVKWKVEVGQIVYDGRVLLLYEEDTEGKTAKLKSKYVGTVIKLIAKEGEIINPGEPLLELAAGCSHPTVINDLCAECGADLQKEGVSESNATVPMVHSIPQLKVSHEQAQMLGKADTDRLLKDRKLVLLVDLDQTLIHTTHDNIPNNLKDVHHFQLGSSAWYHTRLRPGTARFLREMNTFFELHICTFGVRPYAHTVARILDRDGSLFSNRILSRDECFDSNSKVANLQALFPSGIDLVCIIDDREDVWNFSPNLIPVKPYHFFQNTGDINDPNLPPIAKHSDFFAKGVKVKTKEQTKEGEKEMGDDLLDVEDEDDYLLYLESILKSVHSTFYSIYEQKAEGKAEVQWVLEKLRGSVLKGCEIVFSGLVPLSEGLEQSEPYITAANLGARMSNELSEKTTHLVAASEGTLKVRAARQMSHVHVVNPHWLITCLYRWERVEERLYPLSDAKKEVKPPISLTLDDMKSMRQEVHDEFGSEDDNSEMPAVKEVTEKKEKQEVNKIEVMKEELTDKSGLKEGENTRSKDEGKGTKELQNGGRVRPLDMPLPPLNTPPPLKRLKEAEVMLPPGYLPSSERLKHFHIPKKARVEADTKKHKAEADTKLRPEVDTKPRTEADGMKPKPDPRQVEPTKNEQGTSRTEEESDTSKKKKKKKNVVWRAHLTETRTIQSIPEEQQADKKTKEVILESQRNHRQNQLLGVELSHIEAEEKRSKEVHELRMKHMKEEFALRMQRLDEAWQLKKLKHSMKVELLKMEFEKKKRELEVITLNHL